MPTEKRQRQKAGRQARLAAEQKARKRRQGIRRVITAVVVIAIVVVISLLIFRPGKKSASSSTTTTASPTSSTAPASTGGSGNKSPSAITTAADCPADPKATLNKPSYSSPPTAVDPNKTYTATVKTDVGQFAVQLDPKAAPKAVGSFVFLARQHFFDCIVFHRVIPGFVDQTGDPTGTGTGGPGYHFADELPPKASPQYPVGSLAMANSGPDTNGSQFFIVTGPSGESLSPNYTLFGKVTSGMDVVQKINADGSSSGTPATIHRMVSVSVNES